MPATARTVRTRPAYLRAGHVIVLPGTNGDLAEVSRVERRTVGFRITYLFGGYAYTEPFASQDVLERVI